MLIRLKLLLLLLLLIFLWLLLLIIFWRFDIIHPLQKIHFTISFFLLVMLTNYRFLLNGLMILIFKVVRIVSITIRPFQTSKISQLIMPRDLSTNLRRCETFIVCITLKIFTIIEGFRRRGQFVLI